MIAPQNILIPSYLLEFQTNVKRALKEVLRLTSNGIRWILFVIFWKSVFSINSVCFNINLASESVKEPLIFEYQFTGFLFTSFHYEEFDCFWTRLGFGQCHDLCRSRWNYPWPCYWTLFHFSSRLYCNWLVDRC